MSEKPKKKVSLACNICRLKRKKCDGLNPCLFCTENKLECAYSREARRRGPPSGYLRYTEARVSLLETLLGLYMASSFEGSAQTPDQLLKAAKILLAESKVCTQDVWDTYKESWTVSESARILEELAMFFAPFRRSDHEGTIKTLLPIRTAGVEHGASLSLSARSATSPPTIPIPIDQQSSNPLPSRDSVPRKRRRSSLILPPRPLDMFSQESFERTQQDISTSSYGPPMDAAALPALLAFQGRSGDGLDRTHYSAPSSTISAEYNLESTQMSTDTNTPTLDTGAEANPDTHSTSLGEQTDTYTGSYWRVAELALPDLAISPQATFYTAPSANGVELPPPHILSNLLDVYYQYVYPSYPFLPTRSSLDTIRQNSSASANPEGLNAMLLALCAYSGRLSPSLGNASPNIFENAGDAGKVAADLWYDQARTAASANVRKGSSIETVQALLLLALRDHGKGNESQAWLLVGLAVRMGQDLDLNDEWTVSSHHKDKHTDEGRQIRQNTWGASLMLDLFLSLQLGRPPALSDALRPPKESHPPNRMSGTLSSPMIAPPLQPLFSHTVLLCQIISRINFHFYLGYSPSDFSSQSQNLVTLKAELDTWHKALPHEYWISIGHQPEREVLEVSMLYHVAIILLYRPFSKDNSVQQASDVFLEAASTFSVLLEKHRQFQTLASNPPLYLSNPNMIYLIFTVSIAHLTGFKLRQRLQQSQPQPHTRLTTLTLQTQVHLLNCLEALTSIGGTWELARRCWRTLDKLMDVEGMKPRPLSGSEMRSHKSASLGKRKREGEDNGRRSLPEGEQEQSTESNVDGSSQLHDGAPSPMATTPVCNNRPIAEGLSDAINTRSPFVPSEGGSVFSQNERPLDLSFLMAWKPNQNSNIGPTAHLSSASLPISTELLDPSAFPSAGWLPELPEDDLIGLGTIWDGEWDEGLWALNLTSGT